MVYLTELNIYDWVDMCKINVMFILLKIGT